MFWNYYGIDQYDLHNGVGALYKIKKIFYTKLQYFKMAEECLALKFTPFLSESLVALLFTKWHFYCVAWLHLRKKSNCKCIQSSFDWALTVHGVDYLNINFNVSVQLVHTR